MRIHLLPIALLIVLVACGEEVEPDRPGDTALGPDSFRTVLIELAISRVEAMPDTQAWSERRGEILDRYGVSREDLREFVEAYGGHDEVMVSIYRELKTALDSLAETRPPGEGAGRFPGAEAAGPDTIP